MMGRTVPVFLRIINVVTPAGASLTMYREIRPYANSIWDDNNNNNKVVELQQHTEYKYHLIYT